MAILVLVFLAIAAFALPFFAVAGVATILLTLCEPKTRFGAVACYIVPASAILAAVIVWGSTVDLWRYAEPIMRRIAWPALTLICLGIIAGRFCSRRQLETPVTLEARWSSHLRHLTMRWSERRTDVCPHLR
jgi:hypothetical protein